MDWLLFNKKKMFALQFLFSLLFLFVFGFVFFLFAIVTALITIGMIIFLLLMISKSLRMVLICGTYLDCKKSRISTKVTMDHIRQRKVAAGVFSFLFLFPLIILSLGFTPISLAAIEINVNNQRGQDQGSNEIQLSFYATLSSYDYLTNTTILSALNGSSNSGNPVEILLLVSDSSLKKYTTDAPKLAYMVGNCTASGLKVWIWFIYDDVPGHYPSHMNYDYMPVFKALFDEWVSNYSLSIYGMLFDNEMDDQPRYDNILEYLDSMLDKRIEVKKDWSDAVNAYKTAAAQWSAQGYKIALVGMEQTLYDVIDGDPDVQQLFGIVDDPPGIETWERVSFMFYRSCEYHAEGTKNTQDYLYTLAECNKRVYGSRAVVAIGCMSYAAYDTINEIKEDIAILKFLNYDTIELFEMSAFMRTFGYDGLLSLLETSLAAWKFPSFRVNIGTTEFLSKIAVMLADVLLDFF